MKLTPHTPGGYLGAEQVDANGPSAETWGIPAVDGGSDSPGAPSPPRGPEAAKQAQFAVLMCAFCCLELPHALSCEPGQRPQSKL